MTCATCGGVLQAGARFCGDCGTAVPVATAHVDVDPRMTCATCGGVLEAGARFCAECGTAVPVATPPPAMPPPPSTATAVPPTATPSGSRRLVVDASGGGDHKTIAKAVQDARGGDTIVLRPGTYQESLEISSDVRIVGEGGRSKVIVEGAPGADVFWFESGSATLTGLTIRVVAPVRLTKSGVRSLCTPGHR